MKRFLCVIFAVLFVAALPAAALALAAPAISVDVSDVVTNLTWEEVEDASYYEVYVSRYPYGGSNLVVDDVSYEPTYSAVFSEGKYRANMRAISKGGKKSALSNTVYFTVKETKENQASEVSEASEVSDATDATVDVVFMWPVKDDESYSGSSYAITAMDIYFDGGDHGKLQNALDINHDGMKTRYETREIVATAAGTVIDVYSCGHGGLYCSTRNCEGTYIKIKHDVTDPTTGEPFECISFYTHLDPKTVTVEEGDYVEQGQTIAKMGSSGNSSGIHLHFAIRSAANKDLPTLEYFMNDVYMPLLQFKYFTRASGKLVAQNGEKSRYSNWVGENYVYKSGRWVYKDA